MRQLKNVICNSPQTIQWTLQMVDAHWSLSE